MSAIEFAVSPRSETLAFDCKLRGGDLIGLSFKNTLLNIVTLSLYRFWAKTTVRKRIWAGVTLNDEPFEYTGRGMELFKGFLIAVVAFGVPLVLLSFLSAFLGPAGPILMLVVTYGGLFAIVGVATFTSFRYRASRTTWRGVRFQLTGSAVSYGLKYLGYLLLSGVTLGWFWPAAQRRLAAPLWGALKFGDRPLRFDIEAARKVGVYKPFVFAWCGGAVFYALLMGFIAAAGAAEEGGEAADLAPMLMLFATMLLAVPAVALLGSAYQAAILRSITAGVRLDDMRFELHAKWTGVLSLWLTNAFIVVVSLGIFTPVTQMRTIRFVLHRLKAVGEVDLSTVRQVERGPKSGEGLADIFDLAPV
jgi:uncharacterized membrane protein YjgN (DUF898 family)